MKRYQKLACLGVALGQALLAAPTAWASDATARIMINVRAEPDRQSTIQAVLRPGQSVEVLEQSGEFARVRTSQGREGYLKSKYLLIEAGAGEPDRPVASSMAAKSIDPPSAMATPEQSGAPQQAAPAVAVAGPSSNAEEPELMAAPVPPPAPPTPPKSAPPWYVKAWVGSSRSDADQGDLQAALQAAAPSARVQMLDDSATNYGFSAGYQLRPWLAMEAGLLDLGEYDLSYTVNADEASDSLPVLSRRHPVGGAGFSVSLRSGFNRGAWSAQAVLGAFFAFESETEVQLNDELVRLDPDENSVVLGLEAGYRLSRHWQVGLALQQLELNSDLLAVNGVLTYRP